MIVYLNCSRNRALSALSRLAARRAYYRLIQLQIRFMRCIIGATASSF